MKHSCSLYCLYIPSYSCSILSLSSSILITVCLQVPSPPLTFVSTDVVSVCIYSASHVRSFPYIPCTLWLFTYTDKLLKVYWMPRAGCSWEKSALGLAYWEGVVWLKPSSLGEVSQTLSSSSVAGKCLQTRSLQHSLGNEASNISL